MRRKTPKAESDISAPNFLESRLAFNCIYFIVFHACQPENRIVGVIRVISLPFEITNKIKIW